MKSELRLFEYFQEDGKKVRTAMIGNEIWFAGIDIATALGYGNTRQAIIRHCKSRGVTKRDTLIDGIKQSLTFINESNVYRLITRSQLPTAERFEEWLFEEVVPAIRKTGGYGLPGAVGSIFLKRYYANYDKLETGYFSVISELYIRLHYKLAMFGHILKDVAPDGKELRPDVSIGRSFAAYLRQIVPDQGENFKYYNHTFESGIEVQARQYPMDLLGHFGKFVETIWMPQNAESYLHDRDPQALQYLPKLLGKIDPKQNQGDQ